MIDPAAPAAPPPPLQPRTLSQPYRWGDAPTEAQIWALERQRRVLRHRLIAENEDPVLRADLIAAERELCRRDVVHWAENWAWIANPKAAATRHPFMVDVPVTLWPDQLRLLRWMEWITTLNQPGGTAGLTQKGRELGVTWLHLLFVLHRFEFYERWRSRLFSAKQDKVDDGTQGSLFGMLRYVLTNLPTWLTRHDPTREDTKLWLGNKANAAQIVGESANTGLARGERDSLLFGDEFAFLDPPSKAWDVWTSTESVANTRLVVSTHHGPGTRFAQLAAELPPEQVFTMTWRSDPRRPASFKADRLRQGMTAQEFEQEHEARAVVLQEGLMFSGPPDPDRMPSWLADPGTTKGKRPSLPIRAIEYWDEHPEFARVQAEEDILRRGFLCGGWDFGTSAVSALVCLHAIVEPGPRWRLWIDAEHKWHQTGWMTAATDVTSWVRHRYCPRDPRWWGQWGDPAGIARDSDLRSWQDNLRAGGLPLTCLDAYYNTREGQEWAFREAQSLIDSGRLYVHRRCEYLWSCLESWSRAIPHGGSAELLDRLYIPPRHDGWSHGGMAFAYLIAGVLISMSAAHDQGMRDLESTDLVAAGLGVGVGRMLDLSAGA